MPELPEMQALAERLDALVAGHELTAIAPLQFSALKTFDPPYDSLIGATVGSVSRRGKYLVLAFSGPRLLVHLSQGGRIDVEQPPKATRPKGAVVRFCFGAALGILIKEYGTERKAGWWIVADGEEGPLSGLGPEPDSQEFSDLVMGSQDNRRVHTLLRDQRTVAGVGRGYTDDILHAARLSPYVSMSKLSEEERRALLDATHRVLDGALAKERERTGGLPAKLSDRFAVHGRHGQPCPRCGRPLERVWFESHEIVYCPDCQTGGKVLADRRLSRIVK